MKYSTSENAILLQIMDDAFGTLPCYRGRHGRISKASAPVTLFLDGFALRVEADRITVFGVADPIVFDGRRTPRDMAAIIVHATRSRATYATRIAECLRRASDVQWDGCGLGGEIALGLAGRFGGRATVVRDAAIPTVEVVDPTTGGSIQVEYHAPGVMVTAFTPVGGMPRNVDGGPLVARFDTAFHASYYVEFLRMVADLPDHPGWR